MKCAAKKNPKTQYMENEDFVTFFIRDDSLDIAERNNYQFDPISVIPILIVLVYQLRPYPHLPPLALP